MLFELGLTDSRQKSQYLIQAGKVEVNKKIFLKNNHLITGLEKIRINNNDENWVSRGALKLIGVFESFPQINVQNKICLDVGSGTGGFTEILLYQKAHFVYAVDVGRNQFSNKLKLNPNVKSFEGIDIRKFNLIELKEQVEIIVCDVSFISVTKILRKVTEFAKKNAWIIVLVKPQFELTKQEIEKNGIIKNPKLHLKAISSVKNFIAKNLNYSIKGLIESPIKGMKGNKEFFLVLRKKN